MPKDFKDDRRMKMMVLPVDLLNIERFARPFGANE
jgi:hypothetical protein